MISAGEWGVVRVTAGQYKGRVGYFDETEGSRGIVYFGTPFATAYVLIPLKYLEPTDITHAPTRAFLRKQPSLARDLGIKL